MDRCFLIHGNKSERGGINQREIINIEQPLFVVFYYMAGSKVHETYDFTYGIHTESLQGMYLVNIHIKSGEVERQKMVF
jgi:hypothetical protein